MALGTAIRQAAAIPVMSGKVCLVTSSSGKRWVVPKGRMEPGKTAGEIALQEAWEEAGLTGWLHREPVGTYLYEKIGSIFHVVVFIMHATHAADDFPEVGQRERIWLNPTQALARVEEPGLREIIRAGVMTDEWRLASI
jgi:8-oxo-dGTP pyrophosphatase MutT (NUDIX family)